jgi:hypothetical protein
MDQQQQDQLDMALFLQLPYEARYDIYKEIGYIFSDPITHLTWWRVITGTTAATGFRYSFQRICIILHLGNYGLIYN